MRWYPRDPRLIIEGDLNGDIGAYADGYEGVYADMDLEIKMDAGYHTQIGCHKLNLQ